MKKIYIFIFLIASKFAVSQSTNQILNIADSLTHPKEIRMYKFISITNYSELFRIYQKTDKSWNVEFFKCYRASYENEKSRYEKIQVNVKTNFDLFWLKILNTDIENLADWEEIQYKFKKKGEIRYEHGEYELYWEKKRIVDGVTYKVFIRNGKTLNTISYSNPEVYLKYYPEINELNSFSELLNLVKDELDIFK